MRAHTQVPERFDRGLPRVYNFVRVLRFYVVCCLRRTKPCTLLYSLDGLYTQSLISIWLANYK